MSIKELKARLAEINREAKVAEKNEDTEKLDALLKEAEDINEKINNANKLAKLNKLATDADDVDYSEGEKKDDDGTYENKAEKRGKALKAGNTVTMSKAIISPKAAVPSPQTVMPHHTSNDINTTFNDVSSLIDLVKVVPLNGGESYTRGFEKSFSEGDYTAEGAEYHEGEPEFGYADIKKTKITHYVEEPEEIKKLAPAAYDSTIRNSTSRGVRKKIARQIMIGAGTTDTITGIFNAPETVIEKNKDLVISQIDANTLDEIIFAYGGEEDVEGLHGLVLNKSDLKAFAMLRGADDKKIYTVKANGNTGTIDGVPYVLNSACPALSKSTTADNTYCMAYGPFQNYELAIFADVDVQESKHYKFRNGQIAYRADAYVGGNVAAWNGFVRIKKGSAEG